MSDSTLAMGISMLEIAAVWALASIAFIGLGLSFLRWFRAEANGAEGMFAAFWIGWALALGFLQVWQLFRPIDGGVRLVILGLGWAGVLRSLGAVKAAAGPRRRVALPLAAAAAALVMWMANRSMSSVVDSDIGLYHLGTLRWLEAYPIVPGLGNLHSRLAYNLSYFLYMAAMDVGPWDNYAHHVAAYLLLTMLCLQVLWNIYSASVRRWRKSAGLLFWLALLPAIVNKMFAGVGYGEPDLAVWSLGIVVVSSLVRMAEANDHRTPAQVHVLVVLIVSSALATVKLSGLVLGAAASVLALREAARSAWFPPKVRNRLEIGAKAAAPMVLLLGAWVLRGYILSGYPAFPSTIGGLDVDWRVPPRMVTAEADWIRSWARLPGVEPASVLTDARWVQPWWDRVAANAGFDLIAPLTLGLVCIGLARGRAWNRYERELAATALPSLLALGAWFVLAPEPRFAGAAPWLLAATGVVVVAERWQLWRWRAFPVAALLVSLGIGIAAHLDDEWRVRAGPEDGFHRLPTATLIEETLPSGLTILRPSQGDQCWEAPLLCTPYPMPGLQLRVSGSRRWGFIVLPRQPQT